jgi:hypothetical protein
MPSSYITFSTNPNDWTAAEGLYIDQVKQETSVTGVNTNRVGLFDQTLRGPTTPQVLGSYQDFLDLYGGRDAGGGGAIVNLAWKALLNRKFAYPMVFCRVAASAAVKAFANASNVVPTSIIKIEASSPGVWANGATGYGISYAIEAASNGVTNAFDVLIKYAGKTTRYANILTYASGDDNCAAVVGNDSSRLVNITKLAAGRPLNTVADVNLASGTEGTVAIADYEAAFDAVAAYPGVRIVPCACSQVVDANTHATFNGYVETNADEYPLTTFLVWAGSNKSRADEITAKNAQMTTPQDNVWWCYNASSTVDRDGNFVETGPHLDMAVILNNTDVAVHPGSEPCIPLLSGVKKVYNEGLKRGDFVLLREAGICALEHVDNGFQFHSVVASSSSGDIGGNTAVEGADVRRAQWIVESQANAIKHDVKMAATESRMRGMKGKLISFASDDSDAEHVVAKADPVKGPAWDYRFVQTSNEAGRNLFKLMAKTRILPMMLSIVMQTEIGTGVTTVSVTK